MTTPEDLAAVVEGLGEESDNALDVRIEIALFRPDGEGGLWKAVRANAAGTKVIYTMVTGDERTYWPRDWTEQRNRAEAIAALRAQGGQHE